MQRIDWSSLSVKYNKVIFKTRKYKNNHLFCKLQLSTLKSLHACLSMARKWKINKQNSIHLKLKFCCKINFHKFYLYLTNIQHETLHIIGCIRSTTNSYINTSLSFYSNSANNIPRKHYICNDYSILI